MPDPSDRPPLNPPSRRTVQRLHSPVLEYEKLEVSFIFASKRHYIPLMGDGTPTLAVGLDRKDIDAWGLEQDVTVAELKWVGDDLLKFLLQEIEWGCKKIPRTFLAGAAMAAIKGRTA